MHDGGALLQLAGVNLKADLGCENGTCSDCCCSHSTPKVRQSVCLHKHWYLYCRFSGNVWCRSFLRIFYRNKIPACKSFYVTYQWFVIKLFIIALFCCTLQAGAQDLSGFWKGSLTMTGGCFAENNIEIQINVAGGTVSGNSYHYLDIHNYVKKSFNGTYTPSEKKITVNETDVTTFKIPSHCIVCIKNYTLVYSRSGNEEILTGVWDGTIMNSQAPCQPGNIVLRRIAQSAFREIPEITVDTGQVRLDFYDNGEIDGDSITVTVNKKVVLQHQRLTAQPITTYLTIAPGTAFYEVEMVAENLGSIPPNTAVLIITAGIKRYQLFLASSPTKSAYVRFIYEKAAPL
jgi:hypothetical protein